MTTELSIPDREAIRLKVSEQWLKGNKNPTAIARDLGLKRVEVLAYIEESKEIFRSDPVVKERAQEALQEADAHLNLIINRSWETVEQADGANDLKTKATVLKNIADVEFKKVEMLQKAGLYDDAALGDELAQMEEKQEALKNILLEVTADCPHCSQEIRRRLSRFGKSEPMVVKEDGSLV